MPRRNCCNHPTRHKNGVSIPKGTIAVSVKLSKFLITRYDLDDSHVRWLCPSCHSSETKEMENYQSTETSDIQDASNNESVTQDSHSGDDDDINEDENHPYMDSGVHDESINNDDNDADDDESMDVGKFDHEECDDEDDDDEDDDEEEEEEEEDDDDDNESMDVEVVDDDESDLDDSDDVQSDNDSHNLVHEQNKAMEKLSTVFHLLNIAPIHDKLAVRPIRAKVDEAYRILHQLCDALEKKSDGLYDPNPHDLLISESNQLLDGLKTLFNKSDEDEQVRLMTIAPKQWGRKKIEKWFQSKQSQARRSLILRKNEGVLAYPQCLRGNPHLSDATIDAVVQFYCEDGISRVSSNSKDTIQVNKKRVPVRFMEMTVLDADGASGHFKNNASILNLVHHKADFGMDAWWTFTASGHGKAAGDGIGAVLKSTARRVTLSKNILLSTPKDFYEFSRQQQLEAAHASSKTDPGIEVFFLDAKEVEKTKANVLKARSEQIKTS
ncbi:unnamed protein product, partial [Rotaria sp. Silwood2]